MRTAHDHVGTTLTFGCPACVERVRLDQDNAARRDAPVRHCTWRFNVQGKAYSFTLDVKVPTGWEPWQVDDEYAGDTGEPIAIALGDEAIDGDTYGQLFWEACETIRCSSIGPIVPQVVAVPDQDRLL